MPRDTRRRFNAEINRMTPTVRNAFLQAVSDVKRSADVAALTAAIEAGDVPTVTTLLNLGPEFFAPLDEAVRATFAAGGNYTMSSLPAKNPGTGKALVIRFQGRLPRAERWVTERSSKLIVEILDDQRNMVREIIARRLSEGVNPRKTALDLVGRIVDGRRQGGVVGLTSRELQWVQNFEDRLHLQKNPKLTEAQIRKKTLEYHNKTLLRRGERIARTETIAAMNAGRDEGFSQLIDRGEVDAQDVVAVWSSTGDSRTREIHMEMNGQTREHGEPFDSPTGSQLLRPGDTSLGAHGEDTVNCRCYKHIKVDYLAAAARNGA